MHLISWRRPAPWLVLAVAACGGGDGPVGPPAQAAAAKLGFEIGPSTSLASGNVFSTKPVVQLRDATDHVVPAAGVAIAVAVDAGATLGGTTSMSTDAAGHAAFADLSASGTAGLHTLTFSADGLTPLTFHFTLTAGVATQIAASTPASQTSVAGAMVTPPPAVVVKDAGGNPVSGVLVVFAVASGGGRSTIDSMVSGPDGTAHVGSWTLGAVVGSNTLTATADGLTGSPVTFTAIGGAVAPGGIVKNAGDAQSAPAFSNPGVRPAVLVTSNLGAPMAGVPVTFTVGTGGGTVTGGSVNTDASGIATVGTWTLGAPGANTLIAAAAGVPGSPLTFNATAVPLGTIQIASGDQQVALTGGAVAVAPTVLVTGPGGAPVAGASVTFAVSSGGGSVSAAPVVTDAQGHAAAVSWTLGAAPGVNHLTASLAGFAGSPLTFTATGSTVLPAGIAFSAGNNQTATVGTTVAVAPSVIVTAGDGTTPVPNITVTFTVGGSNPGAAVTGSPALTNAQGIAAVGSWTIGHAVGASDLVATAAGVAGSVTFHATGTAGTAVLVAKVGDGQNIPAGQPVGPPTHAAPGVTVSDQYGNHLAGIGVTFALGTGGGTFAGTPQVTDAGGTALAAGWTVSNTTGDQTLIATVAGIPAPVTITEHVVAGPVTSITIVPGSDGQNGTVKHPLSVDPGVVLKDQFGNLAAGVPVQFVPNAGSGTAVSGLSSVNGVATTKWKLGPNPGAQSMVASVNGGALTAQFTATAFPIVSQFNISVRTLTSVTPSQQAALDAAAQRWSEILPGDLPNVSITLPAAACGVPELPAMNEVVDDVVIFVIIGPIDGTNGILAESGPCIIRASSSLPAMGVLRFDQVDLASVEAAGELPDVILHEMGHVLGFGTIWDLDNLVQGGGTPTSTFVGTAAATQYRGLGGTAIGGVPLETGGGPGTADSHWRESIFGNELMTGFISGPGNPLSVITIGSMADLGYSADYELADALPTCCSVRGIRGTGRSLGERPLKFRPIVVDAGGRPIGQLR